MYMAEFIYLQYTNKNIKKMLKIPKKTSFNPLFYSFIEDFR